MFTIQPLWGLFFDIKRNKDNYVFNMNNNKNKIWNKN